MGKEAFGPKRVFKNLKKRGDYIKKKLMDNEFTKNWKASNFLTVHDVSENTMITVTIKSNTDHNTVKCRGFKQKDNNYSELTKHRKKLKLFKKSSKMIMYYTKNGLLWMKQNVSVDKFHSGQHILAYVGSKREGINFQLE